MCVCVRMPVTHLIMKVNLPCLTPEGGEEEKPKQRLEAERKEQGSDWKISVLMLWGAVSQSSPLYHRRYGMSHLETGAVLTH